MTLDDLSTLLETWPKQDHNGEPSELWLMTASGLSSPAKVVLLNGTDLLVVRDDDPMPAAEPFEEHEADDAPSEEAPAE